MNLESLEPEVIDHVPFLLGGSVQACSLYTEARGGLDRLGFIMSSYCSRELGMKTLSYDFEAGQWCTLESYEATGFRKSSHAAHYVAWKQSQILSVEKMKTTPLLDLNTFEFTASPETYRSVFDGQVQPVFLSEAMADEICSKTKRGGKGKKGRRGQ